MPGRPARKLRIRWPRTALLCSALGLVMCGIVLSAAAGSAISVTNRSAVYPPTSKDQCKDGGWKNYGTMFKNQGQCVSFVATGGKHG